jgi:hypothetical protein
LLLLAALSRRDSERLVIAVACLDRRDRQCERNEKYKCECKRKNADFHFRTCSGWVVEFGSAILISTFS